MTPPLLSASDCPSVEQLGERIADIAAGIHASTYQLLVLLYDFDERKGWNNGFLSCAHWLTWRTGIDPGAAREKVRVARALPNLPLLSGALQRGEISYTKVRALTRIAKPATEERLVAVAFHGTAAQVERLVRAWRRCDRLEDERKHLARSVVSHVDDDGMIILRARLTPEQGAVVQKALEAGTSRRTRTIPMPLRRSLVRRDGHCTFPGCESRRCDAHHVVHWADGGATALANLVLLCRRHHTLVHDGRIGVERNDSGVGGWTLRRWDGTPLNVGYAIDVLHPRANPVRPSSGLSDA